MSKRESEDVFANSNKRVRVENEEGVSNISSLLCACNNEYEEYTHDEEYAQPEKSTQLEKYTPANITTLKELIEFAWTCEPNYDDLDSYGSWFRLWNMIPELTELDSMIGMEDLKNQMVNVIMYYTIDIHYYINDAGNKIRSNKDSLHSVIMGSPGCGKTEVASIIAKIYVKLGVLESDEIVYAKTTDFIGKFLGHSEHNTLALLQSGKGKVIFYDEAYGIGDNSKNITSYSKASINILNDYLEKHKHEFAFIIAGYKEHLEENFFSVNPGLKRRFRWIYSIKEYTSIELLNIFFKIAKESMWKIEHGAINEKFFTEYKSLFPYSGGDMVIFLDKCIKAYTRRVFVLYFYNSKNNRVLTKLDIKEGMSMYKTYKESILTKEDSPTTSSLSMYL